MDGFIAFITADTLKVIWSGLKVTLLITAAGLLLGTFLAALLCAASRSKIIVLRIAEKVFSVVVRGTPVLMLLLLLFYVVFARTGMSAVMVAIIGFGLNTAAHVSEIMKSALMAVDAGQVKAARTLGFSAWHAFWYVTFPQAVAFAISRARCKMRIEATVSRLATKSMKLRGRTVTDTTPIFTYTVNGKEYTYKAEMSTTNRKRFTVGQKEFIYINDKNPEEAHFGNNFGFLLFGICCVLVGAVFIGLTII